MAVFTHSLPFFHSQHPKVVAVTTSLKDKIKELEYAKSYLENSIRASKELQKSMQIFESLFTETTNKVGWKTSQHERTFTNSSKFNAITYQSCNSISCPPSHLPKTIHKAADACACISIKTMSDLLVALDRLRTSETSNKLKLGRRSTAGAESDETNMNFTYVPPPKTDITPQLLSESLALQPQDTATVGSVMPFFQDDVISFGCQLNGFIASTITLNASTELPCHGIGTQSQPDLELRPKNVDNGTTQAYIPDCSIVAVNMYDPNVITYWVQDKSGAIYSVVGSNKIIDIDQLNSTASTSLVLRAKPAGSKKRDTTMHDCNMAGQDIVDRAMQKRAVLPPDWHTASMSPEACAAIKCNNNGGNPAMFNPFTKTCGCREPAYVEFDNLGQKNNR